MPHTSTPLRHLGGSFLLLSVLVSCDPPASSDEPAPETVCSGAGAITTSKLYLRATEDFATSGRTLRLHTRTQAAFPCINYLLPATTTQTGQQLTISYGTPYSQSVCLTAIGPANNLQDITQLAAGTYKLNLQVGTRSTTGTLLVQPDRVELSTCDTNLVAVRQPVLRRIPVGTIWTRAHSVLGVAADDAIVRSMRDSLLRLGARPLTLAPGFYGQFTIDANGEPVINRSGYYPSAVLANSVLTYTGPMARLQAYINRHRAQGVYMYIQADNGQTAG